MSIVYRLLAGLLFSVVVVAQNNTLFGSHCVRPFCINATHDGASTMTYTVYGSSSTLSGWAAIGNGSDMAGSFMQVTWNNGGVVMLSERTATGRVTPSIRANPSSSLLSTESLVNSSDFQSTFTVPTNLDTSAGSASVPMIWSYSSIPPSNPSSSSASIQQHSQQGSFTMNLASTSVAATDGGSTATGTPATTTTADADQSFALRLLEAHGWLSTIIWAVLVPMGILSARYGRSFLPAGWFKYHRLINGLIVPAAAIASTVLAFVGVQRIGDPHLEDLHERLGLAIFILLFILIAAGLVNHHFYDPLRKRRPIRNWMHMVLGVVVLALAYWNIWEGLEDWAGSAGNDGRAKWQVILYFVWLGVLVILFLAGWALIPKQVRQERQTSLERKTAAGLESSEKLRVEGI